MPRKSGKREPEAAAQGEPGFEVCLGRLEELVDRLDDEETTLDEALELYEEAVRLVKQCSQRLDVAEKRLKLLRDDGGLEEWAPADLDPAGFTE